MSAASALVDRGQSVTILDTGKTLEAENDRLRIRLSEAEPEQWDPRDVQLLKQGMTATTAGVRTKLVYASNYVYRDTDGARHLRFDNAKLTRSFAAGGLSNVWGACIAPYPESEFSDWPFPASDLRSHYQSVLKLMPHSGRDDDLANRLPLYSDEYQKLPLSHQASEMLSSMKRHRTQLNDENIHFGVSRVAVDAVGQNGTSGHGSGCRLCGLCLYGCPYGLIYSSLTTLEKFNDRAAIRHISGVYVEKLVEQNGGVRIMARELKSERTIEFEASQVFLGTGIIETARILLESMGRYDIPITVKHSDKFILPFLRYRAAKGVMTERLHTLSQLFMEIQDTELADESVHLQLYTYNDLYRSALVHKAGFLYPILKYPVRKVLERLIIFFGYIHSNVSSEIRLTVQSGIPASILLEGKPNPVANQITKRVVRKLWANRKFLGGVPILASLGLPGDGNHSGGTFPMRRSPGDMETDYLGRPTGFPHVHVVDASVFPSLAATTITLTAMANAHRIASQSIL